MSLTDPIRDFFIHFKSLWSAPRANAPEILISLGILAVVVIILVTVGSTVLEALSYQRRRLGDTKLFLLKLTLYFGAFFVLILFFTAVSIPLTSSPSFCGKACHSMNPQYQSWRRSAHAEVPCYACHIDASFQQIVYDKLTAGTRGLMAELTGRYKKPINASSRYSQTSVPNSRCLRCHAPKNRQFTVMQGLNVNSKVHINHLKAGLRCTTCHNRIAHREAEAYDPIKKWDKWFKYKNYMTMRQGCWRCHRSGRIFVDAQGKKHLAPYQGKNGAIAPTACQTCHNWQWSVKPISHKAKNGIPWGRGRTHGEVARKNFAACFGCHNNKVWCTTACHQGIQMPHIEGWREKHPAYARQNLTLCKRCHSIKGLDFCGQRCHHDVFKAQYNLPKDKLWREGKVEHGVVVRQGGVQPCLRCHEQKSWCTTQCHKGITMPHAASWPREHFKYVQFVPGEGWQRDKAVCVMCHNKDGNNSNYCFVCHHASLGVRAPIAAMKLARFTYKANYDLTKNTAVCQTHAHQNLDICRKCHTGKPDRKL
jgi:cytochrome c nitrite reductase small subunit